jgi:hypothetical protein
MAYIQVSPQYAKSIQYYATDGPAVSLKKGEAATILFYKFADGKDRSDKFQDMYFERLGEYRIKWTIRTDANQHYILKWNHLNGLVTLSAKWEFDERFRGLSQQKDVVCVSKPQTTVGCYIRADGTDLTIQSVLAIVEYIDI